MTRLALDLLACRPGLNADRLCPSGCCATCDRVRLTLGAVDVPRGEARPGVEAAPAPADGRPAAAGEQATLDGLVADGGEPA